MFVFPERMVVVAKKGYERICESMVARSSCEKGVAFMSVFMTVLTLQECCCTDRSERSGENANLTGESCECRDPRECARHSL